MIRLLQFLKSKPHQMSVIFRISLCFLYVWVGLVKVGDEMHVCLCVYHHICVDLQMNITMLPHLTIKCIFTTQVTSIKAKTLNI